MTSAANGPPLYRLVLSELIQDTISGLIRDAYLSGSGPQTRRALKTIFHRLTTVPLEFGELVNKLPNLDLLMHVGVVSPLVVHFGIHEQLKIVFIQKIFRI